MAQFQASAPTYVLVVEDDPILMMSLVDFVEQAGCEPVEANSVREAIQILETRTDIRTVFTDLDMRGSTAGMQLALSIRDRWPPIELLMVSSQPWDASQIPSRGVVLGKPFDRRRIVAAIRAFAA
ncbi:MULTISPECIES: response regulator [Methylorubrum]|jgi:CheY-like chemotaxis protein|uniref:Response regulator receiver n=3 Tax=Methylorubrum TaxID=2282523 RepID=A0A177I1F7_9HYPH|nr:MULTISPECIES: response regulator [Methylorubrum]ACB80234.1 response regulator receiver protein [Methylorubrum populi BJ001]KAB7785609.1 Response regulator receiver [Methylorubrum populi]MBA8911423.1 CheY-like chemotaxis protein [Methylorubrum thiocyanatum]OAH17222.1 histidine kinase [Methylorubrum populi]PZP66782.1 MAG: response regulator [Methylorubrum populi]